MLDVTDNQIYTALISGCEDNNYKNCITSMMRAVHEEGFHTHEQCKAYLGKMFRIKLFELSADSNDIEFCNYILKYVQFVLIDKFLEILFSSNCFFFQTLYRSTSR